ncbi:MAG: hypothetical protein KatS3mg058_1706 [Roseiflexus sp.]|nr:MAG: hypothetical protein KatS3mg058_1706 [Roseiflexus sp.]
MGQYYPFHNPCSSVLIRGDPCAIIRPISIRGDPCTIYPPCPPATWDTDGRGCDGLAQMWFSSSIRVHPSPSVAIRVPSIPRARQQPGHGWTRMRRIGVDVVLIIYPCPSVSICGDPCTIYPPCPPATWDTDGLREPQYIGRTQRLIV